MISEIEVWKAELIRISKKLLPRMLQKKWSSRSIFNLEKELLVDFFIVRKIIEGGYISNEFLNLGHKSIFIQASGIFDKEEVRDLAKCNLKIVQRMSR